MRSRLWKTVRLGAVLLMLTAAANPPAVTLNHLAGKRGPVELQHRAHVVDYKGPGGASITCQDCHHTLAADDTTVEPCVACHVLPTQPITTHAGIEAPKYAIEKKHGVFDLKTLVAHTQCFEGCHKQLPAAKAKALKKCTTCHHD